MSVLIQNRQPGDDGLTINVILMLNTTEHQKLSDEAPWSVEMLTSRLSLPGDGGESLLDMEDSRATPKQSAAKVSHCTMVCLHAVYI